MTLVTSRTPSRRRAGRESAQLDTDHNEEPRRRRGHSVHLSGAARLSAVSAMGGFRWSVEERCSARGSSARRRPPQKSWHLGHSASSFPTGYG